MHSVIKSSFYVWDRITESEAEVALGIFKEYDFDSFTVTASFLSKYLNSPQEVKWIENLFNRHGATTMCCHGLCGSGYELENESIEELNRLITFHQQAMKIVANMGVKTYTVHPQKCSEELNEIFLERLVETAEKLNIIVAYENPDRGKSLLDMLRAAKKIVSPHFGICLDLGHANLVEGGISLYLNKLAPYIVTCHLHDNDGARDQHLLQGAGNIDWKKIITELFMLPKIISVENEVITWNRGIELRDFCATYRKIVDYVESERKS